MRIFDLKNLKTAAPKEVHKFFNFQLEACGCRVEDFKPVLRLTKAISYFVLLQNHTNIAFNFSFV